jgi:hypothetical protein
MVKKLYCFLFQDSATRFRHPEKMMFYSFLAVESKVVCDRHFAKYGEDAQFSAASCANFFPRWLSAI